MYGVSAPAAGGAPAPAPATAPAMAPEPAEPTTTEYPFKTVKHAKKSGGGYTEESPLYKKQQWRNSILYGFVPRSWYKQAGLKRADAPKEPTEREWLVSDSVYVVFVLAFAGLYKMQRPPPLGATSERKPPMDLPTFTRCGFAYSFCDCSNLGADLPICLWSWCCPIVQWAGTASRSTSPFLNFWAAVALMLVLVVLVPFTFGLSGLFALVLLLMRRRHLRKTYNHTQSTGRSWLEDLCLVFCCNSFLCCQLVQEAREVEYTSTDKAETGKVDMLTSDIPRGLPGTYAPAVPSSYPAGNPTTFAPVQPGAPWRA